MESLIAQFLDWLDIAVIVIALNSILYGVHIVLEKYKAKTVSDLDDKADAFIVKALSFLGKIIEVVSANPAHKADDKK